MSESEPPQQNENKPEQGNPPAPQPSRGIFGIVVIVLLVILAMMLINSPNTGNRITLAEFQTLWENNEIVDDSVIIRTTGVTAKQLPAAVSMG